MAGVLRRQKEGSVLEAAVLQDAVGSVKPASHRLRGFGLDSPSIILCGVIKQNKVLFCHDHSRDGMESG